MIFSAAERMLAWRYLRARKAEGFVSLITWFSLLGIMLGVAALIVITSVMNGVRAEMLSQFIGWSGHINVYGEARALEGYDDVIARIKQVDGVVRAIPMIEGQAMTSANGRALGAQVLALRLEDLRAKKQIAEKITHGSLDAMESEGGVMMGERFAENLDLRIGDPVTLIAPEGRQTLAGMVPRMKTYPLSATFKLGMNAFDSGMILMPFSEAQIYFKLADGGADKVSGIEVVTRDADASRMVAQEIASTLGDGYRVYDWQDTNRTVFDALKLQRTVMFVILTLIILVAAFNIISSLIMLVKDKGRDIAILRTMGATRGMVMRIFFACGALIGVAGTAMGLALGLILSVNADNIRLWVEQASGGRILAEQLYFLSHLPAKVEPMEVLSVALMSLGLSFLATLYPALRAARLDPAEGVRYE